MKSMKKSNNTKAKLEAKFYENKRERGLNFKNGIDPQILIKAIADIDRKFKAKIDICPVRSKSAP